ncbi:MAG: hypothetical protein QGF00_08945 [Planctomycetota bacterium]|jgi:hypothetical protein|nr:hypothetical protein [Planctomycetota bacterium]MDP7249713.1 hypothetical protein [Planctomycetota bacterium]|tara:strand:+ start:48 stop:320 length:273 start_codon:yes stop_codon:yes gene_type:complete
MAIKVSCTCGSEYDLKDEFAGRKVECPECSAVIEVPGSALSDFGHPSFNRDKFLLPQKKISISEKYYVWVKHDLIETAPTMSQWQQLDQS